MLVVGDVTMLTSSKVCPSIGSLSANRSSSGWCLIADSRWRALRAKSDKEGVPFERLARWLRRRARKLNPRWSMWFSAPFLYASSNTGSVSCCTLCSCLRKRRPASAIKSLSKVSILGWNSSRISSMVSVSKAQHSALSKSSISWVGLFC